MRPALAYAISTLVHVAALGGLAAMSASSTSPRYRLAEGQPISARFSAGMAGAEYDQPVRFEAILAAAAAPALATDESLLTTQVDAPAELAERMEVERQPQPEPVEQEPAVIVESEPQVVELAIETPPMPGARAVERELPQQQPEISAPAAALPRRAIAAAPPRTGTGADPVPFQYAAQLGVSGGDEGPRNLPVNRPPAYPRDAWLAGIEGQVTLRIVVGADGSVRSARVERSSGSDSLDEAALTAIRRWRFEPATRNGMPIAVELTKPFIFRIRS